MSAALLALLFETGTARAQPTAAAPAETEHASGSPDYERAINAGLAAYRSADFARARELFEQAHAAAPSARTLRALGLTAVEQKDYSRAKQELEAALEDPRKPLTETQRKELAELLAWMNSALGRLRIQVDPSVAQLRLDGRPTVTGALSLVEAGPHQLHAEAEGYLALDRTVSATAGVEHSLQVVLERSPLAPQAVGQAQADAPALASQPSPPFIQPASQQTSDEPDVAVTERWWFWTAIGAVVVGGTITAIALTTSGFDEPSGEFVEVSRAR